MKISSHDEWSPLRSIVVGSALHANWPVNDPVFSRESEKTSWTETPVPSGPVPDWIIQETQQDLDGLADILTRFGIEVYRPHDMDFVALDGMYNYCPRDRLIIAGDVIVDPAMMYPCRDQEIQALDFVASSAQVLTMPRDQGMVLDAANVCRMGKQWLYLDSPSGNRAAYDWLCAQLPGIEIELCNFYAGVHIDSTVVPLRPGLVLLNAHRVNQQNCPQILDSWRKIWVDDVVAQDFFQYPYASKWIGLNMLVVDPNTVIVDGSQQALIKILEKHHFTVIPHVLRHSRTLGGGLHCVTLDLWRQHD